MDNFYSQSCKRNLVLLTISTKPRFVDNFCIIFHKHYLPLHTIYTVYLANTTAHWGQFLQYFLQTQPLIVDNFCIKSCKHNLSLQTFSLVYFANPVSHCGQFLQYILPWNLSLWTIFVVHISCKYVFPCVQFLQYIMKTRSFNVYNFCCISSCKHNHTNHLHTMTYKCHNMSDELSIFSEFLLRFLDYVVLFILNTLQNKLN